jgi:integrase
MASQPKSRARSQRRTKSTKSNEALFTLDEIERIRTWAFHACVNGDRGGALLVALLGTAGRRFEVAALRCGDVRQGPGGPEVFFPEVKGGGNATVPVSTETFKALSLWAHARVVDGVRSSAPLISTDTGSFMHVATLWRLYKQTLVRIGIKRNTGVHATRHAAGFLLLRATNDLTKVQHFLRHSSITTTDAWYKHVHMPDLRAGIEKAGL